MCSIYLHLSSDYVGIYLSTHLTDIYTPPDNRLQRQRIEIHLMYERLGLVYTLGIRIHAIAIASAAISTMFNEKSCLLILF